MSRITKLSDKRSGGDRRHVVKPMVYTVQELSIMLNVTDRTVINYINEGVIPHNAVIKNQRGFRIKKAWFDRWIGFEDEPEPSVAQMREEYVIRADLDGKILMLNRVANGERKDAIGMTAHDMTTPEYHPTLDKALIMVRNGQPSEICTDAYRMDGSVGRFYTEVRPVVFEGKVIGILFMVRELKEDGEA